MLIEILWQRASCITPSNFNFLSGSYCSPLGFCYDTNKIAPGNYLYEAGNFFCRAFINRYQVCSGIHGPDHTAMHHSWYTDIVDVRKLAQNLRWYVNAGNGLS